MADRTELVEELRQKKAHIKEGGDKKLQERFRQQGMLLARERIDKLVDPGTFVELDIFVTHHTVSFGMAGKEAPCEGVITGYGEVDGRPIFLYSQDYSVLGGTLGRWGARKLMKMMEMAAERGAPIVGMCHGGGARFHEFGEAGGSGEGFAYQFFRIAEFSGVIPQISLIMGDNGGGGVYGPGMSDFVIATKNSTCFIGGPPVVKSTIGEEITVEELGSAKMHAEVSGFIHVLAENDEDCIQKARELLSFLPSNWRESPPVVKTDDPNRLCPDLDAVVPQQPNMPFDMHEVITRIVDNGHFFGIHRDYCKNLIVGFGRFDGQTVGIVANNSKHKAGAMTWDAAEKGARFIRFCDIFSIPLVYLGDSPAYMVGSEQERAGIIYRGATMVFATAEATVPKIHVSIRQCNAASAIAMAMMPQMDHGLVYSWPMKEFGMAPATVAAVVYGSEIRKAENPEEVRKQRTEDCKRELGTIYDVASWQNFSDIIEPADTRKVIINALKMLKNRVQNRPAKKYSNIPL